MDTRPLNPFIRLLTIAMFAWSCKALPPEGNEPTSADECIGGQVAQVESFSYGDDGLRLIRARSSASDIEVTNSHIHPLPGLSFGWTRVKSTHITPVEPIEFNRPGEWVSASSRTPTVTARATLSVGRRIYSREVIVSESREVENAQLCIDGDGDVFLRYKEH